MESDMNIDLADKCRVCLGVFKPMHYLFNEFDQGITLKDIVVSTTGFEVDEEDGLPPYACQNCTSIIVEFYNLKTIYEENENQIRAILNSSKTSSLEKVPIVDDISKNVSNVGKESKADSNMKIEDDYITIKIETYNTDNDDCSTEELNSQQEKLCPEEDDEDDDDDDNDDNDDNQVVKSENINYEFQEINTFTCPECGECFLYKNDIHAHMVSKHDISEIDYDEISELSILKVEKPNSVINNCKICNQHFNSTETYNEHVATHKKNVCDVCGIGFIKKSYLKDHQEIHCAEKRHVCNYCNKAFKRRTVLVKHKRIHTHPRQCICEICGKAFNDKGTLKTHIMLVHVKERNYMCLICGIKFPLKGTLEKHIRRHQNKQREFFCEQCPLGYRDKSSLDRHIAVKHSGQSVKSTCGDCGRQYSTLSNLFKHQRNCHNASLQSVEENIA